MKTSIVALIMMAITVASCSDNDDPQPNVMVPEGSWKLSELHHYDKTGKDSATTTLDKSTLTIAFDASKKLAAFTGKPEVQDMSGSYKLDGNYKLTAGEIATDKILPTKNDSLSLVFLKAGYQYELKSGKVIIYSKNKGFMVYNAVK